MRIILGFILALSVSFACDQPHEEVGGYKIGCPFENNDIFELKESANGIDTYKLKEPRGFFNNVEISVINGISEGIYFEKEYEIGVVEHLNDEKIVLESLEKRWGESDYFDITDSDRIYSFEQIDSPVISSVELFRFLNGTSSALVLDYKTDNKEKHEQIIKEVENKKKKESLTGF